jgi:hypothetical protein
MRYVKEFIDSVNIELFVKKQLGYDSSGVHHSKLKGQYELLKFHERGQLKMTKNEFLNEVNVLSRYLFKILEKNKGTNKEIKKHYLSLEIFVSNIECSDDIICLYEFLKKTLGDDSNS